MSQTFILSLIVLLWSAKLSAQPQLEMEHLYDGGNVDHDQFRDLYHCANNDYLLAGSTATPSQPWLMRVDENGETLWDYHTEGISFKSVIEADNGDAIVTGSYPRGRLSVSRLNNEGELLWERNYRAGSGNAIIELKQGDFVVGGASDNRGFLLRIDGDGEPVWSHFYGNRDEDWRIVSIRETDGGIALAGGFSRRDNFNLVTHGWAQKVDMDGEQIWSRNYLFEDTSITFKDMTSIPGGFAIGGVSEGFILFKINHEGEPILTRRLEIEEENPPGLYALEKLRENAGFVFVGWRSTDGQNGYSPLAVRSDSDGNIIWTKDFRTGRDEVSGLLHEVIVLDDQSIVAAGDKYNPVGERQGDAWLLRLEPDQLGPIIFYRWPEDSLQNVLLGDSIQFIVRARDQHGNEMTYDWFFNDDQLAGHDTTISIVFDTPGIDSVECLVHNQFATSETGWHVTVTNLYIAAYSPDTLNLTVQRGDSLLFSIDTVRYIGDVEPGYLWTVTNLNNNQTEEIGESSNVTIPFLRSGSYAVEGRAYRWESSDAVVWNVSVGGTVQAYIPEDLAFDVEPNGVVHFEVVPSEPENESLSIQWLVDGEVAAEDTVALEWSFAGSADLNPHYQVSAVVADSVEADTVTWDVTVRDLGVENGGQDARPTDFGLLSVSPNPFNSMLTIRYLASPSVNGGVSQSPHAIANQMQSPHAIAGGVGRVSLRIYDLSGRLVTDLLSRRGVLQYAPTTSATRTAVWDASAVPAGVYLVRLQSGSEVSTRKVVLMR